MKYYQATFQISGNAYPFTGYDIPEDIATGNEDGLLQFLADRHGNGLVDGNGDAFGAVTGAWDVKLQRP